MSFEDAKFSIGQPVLVHGRLERIPATIRAMYFHDRYYYDVIVTGGRGHINRIDEKNIYVDDRPVD